VSNISILLQPFDLALMQLEFLYGRFTESLSRQTQYLAFGKQVIVSNLFLSVESRKQTKITELGTRFLLG